MTRMKIGNDMFELRVLTGELLGSALPLLDDEWTLGDMAGADINLGSDQRCLYKLKEENGTWLLTDLSNQDEVPPQPQILNIGTPFKICDQYLIICEQSESWQTVLQLVNTAEKPKKIKIPHRVYFIAAFILSVIGVALIITSYDSVEVSEIKPAVGRDMEEAIVMIRKIMQENEILGAVNYRVEQQMIIFSGEIPKSLQDKYYMSLEKIGVLLSEDVVLSDKVKVYQETPDFKLNRIIYGANSHVVTTEGVFIFIGDDLNGWKLISITKTHIVFRHQNGATVEWPISAIWNQ